MFSFRGRWLIYIVLSAILLFVYRRNGPDAIPNPNYPKLPKEFKFEWKNFKEKHPVKSMVPLPSDPVKRLPKVQHAFSDQSFKEVLSKQKPRQEAVKQTFIRAWKAYRRFAWMHDEVTPLTKGTSDTFGGWAATLVDSLDTLWIMGLKDEFHEAVHAAADIDFTATKNREINVFETTIRYLGGLLSAYDLSREPALLTKATELGNILYVAFDTPNRMPVTRWKIHSAFLGLYQEAASFCLLAEIGSLTLEFTRLSQLTKDPKWHDAVHRIMKTFDKQQSKTKLPGMWPLVVDARTQNFQGQVNTFTLGAMADSFYEYLPKMHALLGGVDEMYERMYRDAMAVVTKHNLYRPMVPDNADILISGKVTTHSDTDVELNAEGQHLVCFAGGMFALGSKLFDIPAHMDIARKLTDGCIWTYKATPSGMMPEVFHMVPCPSNEPCVWDEAKYREAVVAAHANFLSSPDGDKEKDEDSNVEAIIAHERLPGGIKSIEDRRYILRPEAIESIFILYRITGRTDLLDTAWEMFTAIEEMTKTPFGNAALDDVTAARGAAGKVPLSDRMESFWLAETLKYFYLMFSDPNFISLDEYVFNTEAHPFRTTK
ncbi:mannosyl-oligosaccharide alpha-1,2-mannosidase [[Emmonsia] crescens]|uniref:alpha-1,2-Mannosidase n=1 Tax=[Emmonsia] crescens TaxID=73230 RepID=A0A2B7ZED0_9EURO|nr:mannosyl-oligosaccharide alpha-1,2-mannosidase [Emmonsia crescens]